MFSPEDGPGPDLTAVLSRCGLDPFGPVSPPFAASASPGPLAFVDRHATTIVAVRYRDGVVMAGDRRATAGSSIAHRAMEKVHPADRHSGIAIAGSAGPAMEMVRLFQLQ
jgi:proteasome beta subunit